MKSIYILFLLFVACSFSYAQDSTIIYQISIPIQSPFDDAEQLNSGEIYLASTDLELINDPDNGGDQMVGLHFQDIPIEQGTNISAAYVQFTTDESSFGVCNLQIHGEATSDANTFSDATFDLSNRPLTTASVDWSPNAWATPQQAGLNQQTPDLANIIQELINQPDWENSNSLNLLFDGSGRRVAHAYEGNSQLAPVLTIEVETPVLTGPLNNVYINELMAKNSLVLDNYNEADDWLELYNANDTAVLLQGLYLSDDIADQTKWQITEPLTIPPNGFIVLWLDDDTDQGGDHAPFKLNADGESVFLSQEQNGQLTLLDEITFEALPENVSYGRQTDGNPQWVHFGGYSPNASNNGNGLFLNAAVEFSLEGGYYPSGTMLSMTCNDPTAEIRFTTNGNTPTATSALYNNPLSLTQTTLIKAAAFKPGYASSPQSENIYFVNVSHELPVVHITIDPDYLWDDQQGMYIQGNNGLPGNCSDEPMNWNQDWERPISIRYFETDGDLAFNLRAGMKIAGGCSRNYSMKPFNIFFRGDTYGDEKVEYPLFSTLDLDEFKRFKLRCSGNDFPLTMIRDASIQSLLFNQSDIDLMAYEPVVVYLNGSYWGFYGMRELFNKHYVAAHHGVDKDSLDFIKNPYYFAEVKDGDMVAWDQLEDFIRDNNLSVESNMDYVAERMDVNEFMNYNIAQIYIANYDWPANNVAVWRHRNNGKWRWMLFDTDISSGFGQWSPSTVSYNSIYHATTTNGSQWPNGENSTLFLRKILGNQAFKNEFAQRTCTFAQIIFAPERATYFIDSLSQRVSSEVPGLINKFNFTPDEWKIWWDQPVGGSENSWQNNLNIFKHFFDNRFDYVLPHYENFFGFGGHYELNINFDADTKGDVVFHKNEMRIPYQYTGQYFKNVPIHIKAIPNEGYYFVRWKETGDTTATIQYEANVNSTLTPIFLADGEMEEEEEEEENPPPPEPDPESIFEVYPVPAKAYLTLKFSELSSTNFTVRIYNLIGQVVYTKDLTAENVLQEHQIDVRDWANGIYILETTIGEKEVLEKLIVRQ